MASVKRIIEKTWLAAFIVIALVFVVMYFKDDRHKLTRIADADWRLLCLAALAQVAYFFASVFTWRKALRYLTSRTIGYREGLSQILLVNFGKYIPGKVWGVAARGKRLNELGFSVDQIAQASYLEQLLLLLVGFWLAFLAAAAVFESPVYIAGFLSITLAIVFFRYGDKIVRKLAQVIPRADWLRRVFEVRISTGQVLLLAVGIAAVWLFLSAAFTYVCAAIISVDLTPGNVAVFVLSLTAGYLAGFLALFAPAGIGVREGVGAALLSNIVTLEEAVLLMLLFRVWVVVAELVAGTVVLASGVRSGEAAVD